MSVLTVVTHVQWSDVSERRR